MKIRHILTGAIVRRNGKLYRVTGKVTLRADGRLILPVRRVIAGVLTGATRYVRATLCAPVFGVSRYGLVMV